MVHVTVGPACRRIPLTPIEVRFWRPFLMWRNRHMFVTPAGTRMQGSAEDVGLGRLLAGSYNYVVGL